MFCFIFAKKVIAVFFQFKIILYSPKLHRDPLSQQLVTQTKFLETQGKSHKTLAHEEKWNKPQERKFKYPPFLDV